ncbi:unnamed protein product [Gongylonema pulchrum]|uniref:WD_REPEATS_REGION domain-containing protein n=1 Tax=Gongylonema pulchrum TaxID=637853 RepID=A0A183ETP9_9BILA|nr:unnamed protein product [Gongylonema pulchrum]
MHLFQATVSSQGVLRIYEAPDIMNISMWSLTQDIVVFRGRCSCLTWSTQRLTKPLIAVGSDDTHSAAKRVAVKWQLLELPALKVTDPVTDIAFAPSAGRSYHLLAVGSKDICIFKMSDKDKHTDMDGDFLERTAPTNYEVTQVDVLENPLHAPIQMWRLSWNITGTILTGASSDGYVRLWKGNIWSPMATIRSTDDYKGSTDDPQTVTSICSLTKESHIYY